MEYLGKTDANWITAATVSREGSKDDIFRLSPKSFQNSIQVASALIFLRLPDHRSESGFLANTAEYGGSVNVDNTFYLHAYLLRPILRK